MDYTEIRYHIDIDRFKEIGKSFEVVAQSRMCPSCQKKVGLEVEERVATVDPKTGKVAFEMRKVPYGSNPFPVFRDCCSKRQGFISATTPVMEAIFRLFLANGNQPLSIEDIHQRLDEWANYPQNGHYLNVQSLKRLIDQNKYYGVRPMEIPSPAQ